MLKFFQKLKIVDEVFDEGVASGVERGKMRKRLVDFKEDVAGPLRKALKLDNAGTSTKANHLGKEREELEEVVARCEKFWKKCEGFSSLKLWKTALRSGGFPLGSTVLRFFLRPDLIIREEARSGMELAELEAEVENEENEQKRLRTRRLGVDEFEAKVEQLELFKEQQQQRRDGDDFSFFDGIDHVSGSKNSRKKLEDFCDFRDGFELEKMCDALDWVRDVVFLHNVSHINECPAIFVSS